jgi:hypothetical protein
MISRDATKSSAGASNHTSENICPLNYHAMAAATITSAGRRFPSQMNFLLPLAHRPLRFQRTRIPRWQTQRQYQRRDRGAGPSPPRAKPIHRAASSILQAPGSSRRQAFGRATKGEDARLPFGSSVSQISTSVPFLGGKDLPRKKPINVTNLLLTSPASNHSMPDLLEPPASELRLADGLEQAP